MDLLSLSLLPWVQKIVWPYGKTKIEKVSYLFFDLLSLVCILNACVFGGLTTLVPPEGLVVLIQGFPFLYLVDLLSLSLLPWGQKKVWPYGKTKIEKVSYLFFDLFSLVCILNACVFLADLPHWCRQKD